MRPTKTAAIAITFALVSQISSQIHAGESCVYPDKREQGGLAAHDDCGVVKNDSIRLQKSHRDNIAFDDKGLACVVVAGRKAFYLHKNGKSRKVVFADNGCDYFERGMARAFQGKHMVFIDPDLNIVLDTGFEWIEHVDYGHAVVCNGPFGKKKVGEYTLMTGGHCGLMDKKGKLVVKAHYEMGDHDAFEKYLNSNNHCPPPPIENEQAALCHAKRHIANMEFHTDDWERYSIKQKADVWLVTFKERKEDEEFVLSINAESAQWSSLVAATAMDTADD